jgi:hypothetical protein
MVAMSGAVKKKWKQLTIVFRILRISSAGSGPPMAELQRIRWPAHLGCLVCLACSSTGAPSGAVSATETYASWSADTVERDLALVMTRATIGPFDAGRDPKLTVALINRSHDHSYSVVLPADGSEVGWREPHVWFTVEALSGAGTWKTVESPMLGRCGNHDERWQDDVLEMAPKEERELDWFPFSPPEELADAATVRIVAHYRYRRPIEGKGVPPALQAMPSFELHSAPLELPVRRLVDLKLEALGPLPLGREVLLKDGFQVTARNPSNQPVTTEQPTRGWLRFEVEVAKDGHPQVQLFDIRRSVDGTDSGVWLAPGAERALVNDRMTDTFTLRSEEHPRRARVELQLLLNEPDDWLRVKSAWVPVERAQ